MRIFVGFVAGLIAGAIAYALMRLPAFSYLGDFATLIALAVFALVWYVVATQWQGPGPRRAI